MAFIRKRGGCFQLVETYRDGGKVHQRLIATLGSNAEPETALAAYQAEFSEHHYRTPRITRRRERLAQRIDALKSYLSRSGNPYKRSAEL